MRRQSIMSRLQSLSAEKKVLVLTSFITLLACFMPWYGINSRVVNEWWNAFNSIGSVAGYVVTIFSLFVLLHLLLPIIKPEWDFSKKFPWSDSSLLLFFSGQSFMVTLLFIPVYAQYSLINATNSGTRFGIYLALISSLIGTISALIAKKKEEPALLHQSQFAKMRGSHRSVSELYQEDERESSEAMQSYEQEQMFNENEQKNPNPLT